MSSLNSRKQITSNRPAATSRTFHHEGVKTLAQAWLVDFPSTRGRDNAAGDARDCDVRGVPGGLGGDGLHGTIEVVRDRLTRDDDVRWLATADRQSL